MPVKRIDCGIECEIKANYKTFGKYIINLKLMDDGILLTKYKTYAPTSIKRTKIGIEFKNMMLDLFQTSKNKL
jgi:hypothetical protein